MTSALLVLFCLLLDSGHALREQVQDYDDSDGDSDCATSEVEAGACTKKTYYFQFGEQGAMEMHTNDGQKEPVLQFFPGRSWALSLPSTRGRLVMPAQWNKCWPQWWKIGYVDKSEWYNGCQYGTNDKVMNIQQDGKISIEDGKISIELSKVLKVTMKPKDPSAAAEDGEGSIDSFIILYANESDPSSEPRSLTFNEGLYYPERVLNTLLQDVTSHNDAQREKSHGNRDVQEAPGLDELESTNFAEYFQGAALWMQNGFRGTGGSELGLLGLVGAVSGGVLGLTARAPLAIWNSVKEGRDLKISAAAKVFAKLSECNTFFKKCGKFELVPKGQPCTAA